jgi:hypothetical protein
MISFKQFIQEKRMGPREFNKVSARLGSAARVGFEFEFEAHIDKDSLEQETLKKVSTVNIGTFESIEDIREYIYLSRNERNSFDNKYNDWVLDKAREEYAHRDDLDEDEKLELYVEKVNPTFGDYARDEYGDMYAFLDHHNLLHNTKYGVAYDTRNDRTELFAEEVENEDFEEAALRALLADIKKALRLNVKFGTSVDGAWGLTTDGSITPSAPAGYVGLGAELISPPLKLEDAISEMEDVFEYFRRRDFQTTEQTGFHINVSLPNMENLDKLKLVLFTGDQYVLKKFQRETNQYTESQVKQVLDSLQKLEASPTAEIGGGLQHLQKTATELLSSGKYSSVNFRHLVDGYIEFRMAGGKNYHRRLEDIKQTILRYVSALEIACDPTLERKEYIKKIANLFNKAQGTDTISPSAELRDVLVLSPATNGADIDLLDYAETIKQRDLDAERKQHLLASLSLSLVYKLGMLMKLHKIQQLPSKARLQLQRLFAKVGVTYEQLKKEVQTSTPADAELELQTLNAIYGKK